MAQYLIGVVGEPDYATLTPEDMQQIMQGVDGVLADLQSAGAFVFAGGLGGNDVATVVDATAGQPVVTDGPFVETKETMGGFTIIDVPTLADAQQWAARFSVVCRCPQEVRPILGPPDEEA